MQLIAYARDGSMSTFDVPGNILEAAWATWLSALDRSERGFWRIAFVAGYKPYENIVFLGEGVSSYEFARTLAEIALRPSLPVSAATCIGGM